jgi:transitional endoplasmic reticulum ATPase
MTAASGIEVLERLQEYEDSFVDITEAIPVFPYDGALALYQVMESHFGAVFVKGVPTMFSEGTATEVQVANGIDSTISLPWGRIVVPTWDGASFVETGVTMVDNVLSFELTAHVRRKYAPEVAALIQATKEECARNSVYRGQAVMMNFRDEKGRRQMMPTVKFFRHNEIETKDLVFSDNVQRSIEGNVLSLINHSDQARVLGVPLKRGILFTGKYGVGKTMLAGLIAQEATKNGWTFLYLRDVAELPEALGFARQYAKGEFDGKPRGCVVFAEDIDRAAGGEERTPEIDKILNTLDGIDSKAEDIMVVLTTNHPEDINSAMLRQGRLDALLHITPPDAEAVKRLLIQYGRGFVQADADLTTVGEVLAGHIPATIREVVERSKLYALYREKSADFKLSASDLEGAAHDILTAQELIGQSVFDKKDKANHEGSGQRTFPQPTEIGVTGDDYEDEYADDPYEGN